METLKWQKWLVMLSAKFYQELYYMQMETITVAILTLPPTVKSTVPRAAGKGKLHSLGFVLPFSCSEVGTQKE